MRILSESVTRAAAKTVLALKENSPHILFGVGIIGVGVGTVLACRATLKVEDKVDKIHHDVEQVRQLKLSAQQMERATGVRPSYSDREYYKDMGRVALRGSNELLKLYGPAILVGGAALLCLTGAHIQLSRRNTALTVAFASVSKAYSEYRSRVREILGPEREHDIYHNVREVEVVGEDGRVTTETVRTPGLMSPYARHWGPMSSTEWERNPEQNVAQLLGIQSHQNTLLKSRGFIFLNDVYHQLGLEKSPEGQLVGWMMNDETSDEFIDFGLTLPHAELFMNCKAEDVWLDFNAVPIHTKLMG